MKRSAPIAGLIFCGLAAFLPVLSIAVLTSGLIRVKLKSKSKSSKPAASLGTSSLTKAASA